MMLEPSKKELDLDRTEALLICTVVEGPELEETGMRGDKLEEPATLKIPPFGKEDAQHGAKDLA